MPQKPKTPFINRILSKRDKLQAKVVEDLLLEVAEERDLFEVIFDSMVEGVVVTDRLGQVIFFNSAAAALLNFQPESVSGRNIRDLLPPGELYTSIVPALESEERIYEAELRVETPVERILRINVIPLTDRLERFSGTVILAIDVTEKKASEARLNLAEKLASRTTISAGIAHEIRNPLNSLSIHLQLAEKQLADLRQNWSTAPESPEARCEPESLGKIEGNLRVIRDEVERLETVVKNFLLAVRPQKPNWTYGDVDTLVSSVLKIMEPEITEHHIRIVFEPLDREQAVPMDEFQIRQALINLLRNAIAAISGKGEIRVRLTLLADRVRIQILDTGEGIPGDHLRRVFEPYFTTRACGTGLGLAVVERIVREHLGRIRIVSEPGQGTCVMIDLPLSAEHTHQIPILEEPEGAF